MANSFKDEITHIQYEIMEHLGKPKDATTTQAGGSASFFWIIQVLSLFLNLINSVIGFFNVCIQAIEEASNSTASSEVPDVVTSTTQRPLAPLSKPRRCVKCHARGHIESDCRTADPAVMRQRVAANQWRKKDSQNPPLIPALPPALPYHYMHNPITFLQPQVNFAALMADALELRRRQTQSAHDKCWTRRSA